MECGNALRVLLASSPLIRALFFDALLRISNNGGNGCFNFVQAVVVNDALPESRSWSISFLGEAVGPASLIIFAISLTVLENSKATMIFSACFKLVRAVLFDTVFGVE